MSGFDYSLLGRRVLCAVSGGADSMYLLHRCLEGAAETASASARRTTTTACAAKSRRGTRPLSRRVRAPGRRSACGPGATCPDTPPLTGMGYGGGRAHAALHFFGAGGGRASRRRPSQTAHNADDNAETVLFALARGSGPRGLAGIPPRRGRIVRPMLGVTRAEIERYLDSHGIEHVEDSTNASLDYSRNRIRALVMPVLRGINPGFAEAAQRSSALLRADDEYLDSLARDFLARYPPGQGQSLGAGRRRLECGLACGAHDGAPGRWNCRHVEAVLALAKSGTGSADVPGARFSAGSGPYLRRARCAGTRTDAAEHPRRDGAARGRAVHHHAKLLKTFAKFTLH